MASRLALSENVELPFMTDDRIMSMAKRKYCIITILAKDDQTQKVTTSSNEVKYQHDSPRKSISNQSIPIPGHHTALGPPRHPPIASAPAL